MKSLTPLAAAIALTACTSKTIPLASMGCTDLARHIGKATQIREAATLDSIAGTIDMLAAENTADEVTGGVESLAGDLTEAAAAQDLGALNRAFRQKGCT